MSTGQQGTFFEKWYKTNFTSPELIGGKRFQLSNGNTLIIDESYSAGGNKMVAVEMKNYLSGGKLEGKAFEQLYDYKRLLKDKPNEFVNVEYVFSTQEAAQNNFERIKMVLPDKDSKVFYIDSDSLKQQLTQ